MWSANQHLTDEVQPTLKKHGGAKPGSMGATNNRVTQRCSGLVQNRRQPEEMEQLHLNLVSPFPPQVGSKQGES